MRDGVLQETVVPWIVLAKVECGFRWLETRSGRRWDKSNAQQKSQNTYLHSFFHKVTSFFEKCIASTNIKLTIVNYVVLKRKNAGEFTQGKTFL
jgi:hypothetical protein